MNNSMLFFVLISNFVTHLIIFILNNFKINQDSPTIFKLITYAATFSINILVYAFFTFSKDSFNDVSFLIYLALTFVLFVIHFILDEDWLFRFDKIVSFIFTIIISLIFYVCFCLVAF